MSHKYKLLVLATLLGIAGCSPNGGSVPDLGALPGADPVATDAGTTDGNQPDSAVDNTANVDGATEDAPADSPSRDGQGEGASADDAGQGPAPEEPAEEETDGATDGASISATAMAASMGFGVNIGNTLENTYMWETGWGQPLISQAYINGLASRGIKTVRVPVAWDTYASDGQINGAYLERVKEVVGWIEAAGMYAIVNIHWDGGWIFNEGNENEYRLTEDVKAKFTSYWQQIASAFAGVGHQLILEGLNEEAQFYMNGDASQAPDYDALNELNQLFVTTVRDQGGFNESRALLIAGFRTDIDLTCVDEFQVPSDPAGEDKLFLSIHFYTPFTFCLLDTEESWGSPQTTWGTDEEKALVQQLFGKLGSFSERRGIPVILGEFAVTPGQNFPRDPASRTLWMEAVTEACMVNNMVPVLWDTGSDVSRADGSLSNELQAVVDGLSL